MSATLPRYQRLLCEGGAIVLAIMDSKLVDGYVVEDWCGLEGNRVEMVCHDRNWMDSELNAAGFINTEIVPVRSAHYEAMPRIQENGINLYIVTATKPMTDTIGTR